jgi:quinol monooxygenase YgiN
MSVAQAQVDVVAHIHALPGQEAALRAVLESFVAPTRLEEGCLRYDLFVDVDQPTKFTFVEEWTSNEALNMHSNSTHIVEGRKLLPGLLDPASPVWIQKLTKVK